ncbi:MAG: PorT family protein [Bacteroidales bacterium]|nr:PorT family protein [Bacteroidales bacterium]
MKRLILITLLITSVTLASKAQIKFGIKGGITSTSIKVDDIIEIDDASDIEQLVVKGENANIGFQGGIMARITIAKIYIQPELLFTSTGGKVEVTEFLESGNQVSTFKDQEFKQIDIPIMLGFKFGPARIQGGPIASIVVDSKSMLKDYANYQEEFNNATWGYQVGVGLDIGKKLTIDVKYEGSLSNLTDGVKIGDNTLDFDSRNSQFVASLGFFF